jgi:hypothetical protein
LAQAARKSSLACRASPPVLSTGIGSKISSTKRSTCKCQNKNNIQLKTKQTQQAHVSFGIMIACKFKKVT